MAQLRSFLHNSALGLTLALPTAALAEAQPFDAIMQPSIMSQMALLDEAPAGMQLAQDSATGPIPPNPANEMFTPPPGPGAPPAVEEPVTAPQEAPAPSQAAGESLAAPQDEAPAAPGGHAPPVAGETPAEDAIPSDYALGGEFKPSGKMLTLEEAIAMAIRNSPERDVAREQINQAIAAVDEARANYFPQLSLRLEAGREYNDPFANSAGAINDYGYNYGSSGTVNMRQMLYDGFITRETVRQRMQLVESSKLSKAKITEELIKSTVEVYMELYRFQQVAQASEENLAALRDIAHMIELRVEAGDASKAEQNYMLARLAAAEQNYITTQAALRDAFSALTYLIGDVEEFNAIQPALDDYLLVDPDEILHKATHQNTEMRIVKSDEKAAAHELKAAKGRYMPELAFTVDGNHSDNLGGFTGSRDFAAAKVQVSYKILDGGLRKATTERQYAKIRETEARQNRVKREIVQAVRRDYNKQQTAIKELRITEQEITANTELEDLYRQQFKQGDIDITNLVESQERIFSARMKKYKLESDMVNVTFSLLRSTAEMLPIFCGNTTGC